MVIMTSLTVREMFQSTVINKGGFGLDDYQIPKTYNYTKKGVKFPKAARSDLQSDASKRAKEPAPSKYAATADLTHKRYWASSTGKFGAGTRKTVIDEVMRTGKLSPGPGAYLKNEQKREVRSSIPACPWWPVRPQTV